MNTHVIGRVPIEFKGIPMWAWVAIAVGLALAIVIGFYMDERSRKGKSYGFLLPVFVVSAAVFTVALVTIVTAWLNNIGPLPREFAMEVIDSQGFLTGPSELGENFLRVSNGDEECTVFWERQGDDIEYLSVGECGLTIERSDNE